MLHQCKMKNQFVSPQKHAKVIIQYLALRTGYRNHKVQVTLKMVWSSPRSIMKLPMTYLMPTTISPTHHYVPLGIRQGEGRNTPFFCPIAYFTTSRAIMLPKPNETGKSSMAFRYFATEQRRISYAIPNASLLHHHNKSSHFECTESRSCKISIFHYPTRHKSFAKLQSTFRNHVIILLTIICIHALKTKH